MKKILPIIVQLKNIADYCPILLKMDQMKELFNDADRKKIENPFKVIADNIEK